MNRKNFIQKTLLGTGILISTTKAAGILQNDIDELAPVDKFLLMEVPMVV